jgi:hypothetical protein
MREWMYGYAKKPPTVSSAAPAAISNRPTSPISFIDSKSPLIRYLPTPVRLYSVNQDGTRARDPVTLLTPAKLLPSPQAWCYNTDQVKDMQTLIKNIEEP